MSAARAPRLAASAAAALLALVTSRSPHALNPYYLTILLADRHRRPRRRESLNLVNGFTGQFSIGHAGFMAVGAYVAAALSVYAGAGWLGAAGAVRCRFRSARARLLPAAARRRRARGGGWPGSWSGCRRCACAATTSRS